MAAAVAAIEMEEQFEQQQVAGGKVLGDVVGVLSEGMSEGGAEGGESAGADAASRRRRWM